MHDALRMRAAARNPWVGYAMATACMGNESIAVPPRGVSVAANLTEPGNEQKKEPGIAASRLLRLPHGSKTFRKVAQAFRKRSYAAFRHRKPAQFRQPSIRRDGSSASGLTSRSGRRAASRCVGSLAVELDPVSVPESGRSEGHKQRNNCATPSIVQTHASRRRANHFVKSNGFRPLLSL